jgi:protein-disulfide isomerase
MFSVPAPIKVNVGEFRPSEIPGYDAVTITFDDPQNKRDLEFLVAKDRKTLMRVIHVDLTKDPYAELMKNIDVSGRPTRGAKDAKVVAVNYDDLQCPFCARMHAALFPTLLKEYGDRILFIYKDYPLEDIHPWALHAAVDANCLMAQNVDAYWDFADYVHANQKEITTAKGAAAQNAALDKLATLQGKKHDLDAVKLEACVKAQDDKAVRASKKEAETLGVSATPEMFVNGRKVDGAIPIQDLRAVFDNALRDAGSAPPEHKSDSGDTN